MKFTSLQLIPEILKALKEKGYDSPTPIQEEAIPAALSGKDILATAQTGTGKTAAFSIPIIQLIADNMNFQNRKIQGLILCPTRELAIQVEENIKLYSKHTPVKHAVIYGGVKQHAQVQQLKKGVDILVATPGRLLDLHNQRLLDLSHVRYFVLDEADRMLDMGFIHDIKRIINIIPRKKQTLLFSATLAGNVQSLIKNLLHNPVRISVDPPASTVDTIEQHLIYTNKKLKLDVLKHCIEEWNIDQAIVFTRTKHGADKIAKKLAQSNYKAAAIHGGKSQNNRQKTLLNFKNGQVQYLIATDIAARGIDIDKLGFVINYEIPNEPDSYVHRIGRSGRAGEDGIAISISEPEENEYIRDIEKLIGQKISVFTDHPYPQTDKPMTNAEKKEERREKERRKQEFFKNRNKNKQNSSHKKSKKRNKKNKKQYLV